MRQAPRFKIFTQGNPKIAKGIGAYFPLVLMLSPASRSGYNVCSHASDACIALCLNTAGRGGMMKGGRPKLAAKVTNAVQKARLRRTKTLKKAPFEFWRAISDDITKALLFCNDFVFSHAEGRKHFFRERRARERKMKPVIRMNGTSDLRWETIPPIDHYPNIMAAYPEVQFYDYTKIPRRFPSRLPDNYYLLYSRSEKPESKRESAEYHRHGVNSAVVFSTAKSEPLPRRFWGRPVIDGDDDDLRFLDPKGVIVGLRAKGYARLDENSGFVVREPYVDNPPVDVSELTDEDFDGGDLFPDFDDVLGEDIKWSD